MPAIYEHHHVVLDAEIDDQGHVNNVEYLRWMNRAAVDHSTAQGWPPQRYLESGGGWVVRTHRIDYLLPAFAGDEIVIRTWVGNFTKATSIRRYHIIRPRDGATLAKAETNWAFISLEHRVPRRIPPELADAFEQVDEGS
ncbi:MAG: acyl-CoA thioesterase [Planctomycetaceae bacterium]